MRGMKPVSLRISVAPTPRLTLWVPILLTGALGLVWLALVALI
jgi:hypothetical protein